MRAVRVFLLRPGSAMRPACKTNWQYCRKKAHPRARRVQEKGLPDKAECHIIVTPNRVLPLRIKYVLVGYMLIHFVHEY